VRSFLRLDKSIVTNSNERIAINFSSVTSKHSERVCNKSARNFASINLDCDISFVSSLDVPTAFNKFFVFCCCGCCRNNKRGGGGGF
jgi:hypothetical protein